MDPERDAMTDEQTVLSLFGTLAIPVNSTVSCEEAPRLSRQAVKILVRLSEGPATNVELAKIGIRYSARICELRKVGYEFEIIDRNFENGVNIYRLLGKFEMPSAAPSGGPWIETASRLPNCGKMTLIFVSATQQMYVSCFAETTVGGNHHVPYRWYGPGPFSFFGHEVSHWAPLPAPPNGLMEVVR